ncbi:M24 family metallopeptidase [Ruegeria arenilitoris]|uniref:M24 family metallopeptidase n=1 Tax=Ruegeria arenilitoris TaxID=1173585 RepID=UPI00147B9CCB|nr:M24 family metallopeptidase [Ruegeria arenilitoris]
MLDTVPEGCDAFLISGRFPHKTPKWWPDTIASENLSECADWAVTADAVAVSVPASDLQATKVALAGTGIAVRAKPHQPLSYWLANTCPPNARIGICGDSWPFAQAQRIRDFMRKAIGADVYFSVPKTTSERWRPSKLSAPPRCVNSDLQRDMRDSQLSARLICRSEFVGQVTGLRASNGGATDAWLLTRKDRLSVVLIGSKLPVNHLQQLETAGYLVRHFSELNDLLHNSGPRIGADTNSISINTANLMGDKLIHCPEPSPFRFVSPVGRRENAFNDAFDRSMIEVLAHLQRAEQLNEAAASKILQAALMKIDGYRSFSFPPIVATDNRTGYPHPPPLKENLQHQAARCLLVDAGVHSDTFTTDATRMVFRNNPSNAMQKAYSVVLKALARASIDQSNLASKKDFLVRETLFDAEYEPLHGVGHGTIPGVAVHPYQPLFGVGSAEKIPDQVPFSIEPGIYRPNEYGCRLENLFVCQDQKTQTLTHIPIDVRYALPEIFTPQEVHWINQYNTRCEEIHGTQLTREANSWVRVVSRWRG